ncbi:MAG: hypothetical protein U5N86_07135 [Planctomycetota bacterium]|nr:hypothetical protein [Planctomycetota bacterium]
MGVNLSQVIEAVISALAKKSFDLAGDLPEGIRKALMEGGMLEAIDKGVVDKIKSGGKNLIDGVKNIFD